MSPRLRSIAPALVWAGGVACVAGFVANRPWTQLPWPRIGDSLALVAMSLLAAWPLRRWRGWAVADALALVWLVALVGFAGALPAVATLLLAASACGAGLLLLPRGEERIELALPAGLAAIGGVAGWLLLLPIHRRAVYAPVLVLPVLLRHRALRGMAVGAWTQWRAAVDGAPRLAAFAVVALGLASTGAWLPTMQADDLAYHLALPSQLQHEGVYRPDVGEQIWALAPWLGDTLHGVAQTLAGREARGALNLVWLLSAAAGVFALARRIGADAKAAWLAVALYASLPMLAMLASGMQTELPAAALLVALALAIVDGREGRLAAVGAALAAGLFALKLGHALAALALLAWALARARGHVAWRRLPPALALFALLACSSYASAWWIGGNPFLPLFNDVFASPLMPAQPLSDARWQAGFGIGLPWAVTFHTQRYFEGSAGAFGFALVALAGAWLLALAERRTRGLAVAASAALLLPMLPMQYARYAFPGLVLLLAALTVSSRHALGARLAAPLLVALCVVDLAFQPSASWLLQVNAIHKLAAGKGVAAVEERYAPERVLIAGLRRVDDGDSIVLALDPRAPYVAELGRRGRTVAWYAPRREAARVAADADASGARWQALIGEAQARWLLLRPADAGASLRAGLARAGARKVAAVGDAELWHVDATEGVRR